MSERIVTGAGEVDSEDNNELDDAWHRRGREIGDEIMAAGTVFEPTEEQLVAARADLEAQLASTEPGVYKDFIQGVLDEGIEAYVSTMLRYDAIVDQLEREGVSRMATDENNQE